YGASAPPAAEAAAEVLGDINLAAVGCYQYAVVEAADENRGSHRVGRRVNHRQASGAAPHPDGGGDVNLAAVGGHRHANGRDADRARQTDQRVRSGVDHRYGAWGTIVGDIDLAAVRCYCHPKWGGADGDRGAHRVARSVDHRHGAGAVVRDIDLA